MISTLEFQIINEQKQLENASGKHTYEQSGLPYVPTFRNVPFLFFYIVISSKIYNLQHDVYYCALDNITRF